MWNYTRSSRTSQKLNKSVQLQIELTTRSTEWKSQQCVKWPETLGESVSVVDANAWAIMHWRSFVFVVSLLSSVSVRCPLTVFLVRCTHTVWLKPAQVWVSLHPMVISMFHAHCERCFWSFRLLPSLHLLPHHHLSLAVPAAWHLHLPWWRGYKPPVQLRRGLWHPGRGITPPQVVSPTTTSLQRLMSNTPRSPWASSSSLMTSTTMTSPSVRRSFMRAEDEPITLEEEGLSSCLSSSVSHDRTGKPCCLPTYVERSRNSETQFWECTDWDSPGSTKRADSRWLSSRDSKTRIPSGLRQREEAFKSWMETIESQKKRNLSCSSRRRTTPTRSTTSSWTVIAAKLGSPWSSWEKSQWNERIEEISRNNIKSSRLWACATARGVCNEVQWCPYTTSRQPSIHRCLTPALTHSQCNLVTLGKRPPLQLSAVGDGSLMWVCHITGTPGCSTPVCSVPLHRTQGR